MKICITTKSPSPFSEKDHDFEKSAYFTFFVDESMGFETTINNESSNFNRYRFCICPSCGEKIAHKQGGYPATTKHAQSVVQKWSGNKNEEENIMAKKAVPKKDGSGKGKRANKGRGGCGTTQKKGKGCNRK